MPPKRKSRKRKVGTAKPGSTVTRRVTKGPGKGDLVRFKANSSTAREPGKLKPRRVLKDVKPKRTQKTLARGKKGKFPKRRKTTARKPTRRRTTRRRTTRRRSR